jgi:hypothetical protein
MLSMGIREFVINTILNSQILPYLSIQNKKLCYNGSRCGKGDFKMNRLEGIIDKICEIHYKKLGYPLGKELLIFYVLFIFFGFLFQIITGGK